MRRLHRRHRLRRVAMGEVRCDAVAMQWQEDLDAMDVVIGVMMYGGEIYELTTLCSLRWRQWLAKNSDC